MSASAPGATRREWVGLAVIALPCLLYSMDLTVLNLAVPRLTEDLGPTSAQLLWIVDIYGFLVAGSLITMGTLGDRIGRRRLLLIGAAAFGVASVLAAFSNSAEMLIASRAVLGLAGATLAPSTLSLIRSMFLDPRERTIAIGVWITSYSVGAAIGPVVGGVLLEYFWWGSVFLVGVPVMVLLLAAGPALLPEYRDPEAGRPDLWSAGLSVAAVLSVIYGLKRMAEDGLGWLPTVSIAAGVMVGLVFLRRQARLVDPLIDLSFFRVPTFSASLATYMLGTFAVFGVYVFTAQYLQLVLGLSPLQAGLWSTPFAGAFIVGSMSTPWIVRRVRPAYLMAAGLGLAAVGFAALSRVSEASGLALVVTTSVVFSLGLAPLFTLSTDLIVGSAPPERAGAAAAISETSSEFGGALGIAMLGSIGTVIYRGTMADVIPPGLTPEAGDAARSTLGGALAAAEELGGPAGAELLGTARGAFAQALGLTAAVSAVVMIATAVVALVLLRHVRPSAQAGGHENRAPEGAPLGPTAPAPEQA